MREVTQELEKMVLMCSQQEVRVDNLLQSLLRFNNMFRDGLTDELTLTD